MSPTNSQTDRILEFVALKDWSGLEKAYSEEMSSWRANQWKEFIDKLLSTQKQELVRLANGMKKKGDVAVGWGELTQQEWGYNQALDDVVDAIEREEEK